jgi:hypothetical protein
MVASSQPQSPRASQKILADKTLEAVHVVAQQLGVVVEHLLEVRNHPALVHAVAVKAAGQLVVDAAARHLLSVTAKATRASPLSAVHGHFSSRSSAAG